MSLLSESGSWAHGTAAPRRYSGLRWMLAGALVCVSGCTFASLGRVTLDGRHFEPRLPSHITVEREGKPLPVATGMELQEGDTVSTGPNVTATILFGGATALLKPNTKVRLGSILAWFGEVFVSGWLTTKTKYASASVEGTKYSVHVARDSGRASFTVAEGHVRITPENGAWEPIVLTAGQRLSVGREDETAPKVQLVNSAQLAEVERALAQTTVPELRGLTRRRAISQLKAMGMKARNVKRVPVVDRARFGRVIEQRPAAGQLARGVSLAVGVPGVAVPVLEGLDRAEAENVLRRAKLKVGRVEQAHGSRAVADEVVRQDPPAGRLVATGSSIGLVVQAFVAGQTLAASAAASVGSVAPVGSVIEGVDPVEASTAALVEESGRVVLPDVTGVAPDTAVKVLEGLGLAVDLKQRHFHGLRRAAVASQAPVAKSKVRLGGKVRLEVDTPGIHVPDLRDKTVQTAIRALRDAGLVAQVTESWVEDGTEGRVISQEPAARELVSPKVTVGVVIARVIVRCTVPAFEDLLEYGWRSAGPAALRSALEDRIEQAGMQSSVTVDIRPDDTFYSMTQDPSAGSRIDCRQPVTLEVVGVHEESPPKPEDEEETQ